jgi:hypothetical protein
LLQAGQRGGCQLAHCLNAQLRHVEWLSINNKPGQYYIEPDQLAEWFQVWKNAEIVEFKVALSQLDVHKLDEICR